MKLDENLAIIPAAEFRIDGGARGSKRHSSCRGIAADARDHSFVKTSRQEIALVAHKPFGLRIGECLVRLIRLVFVESQIHPRYTGRAFDGGGCR
jgi:hypothetical protein